MPAQIPCIWSQTNTPYSILKYNTKELCLQCLQTSPSTPLLIMIYQREMLTSGVPLGISWHSLSWFPGTQPHTRRDKLFSHHHPQHPYSRASCIQLHYNYRSDPESDTGRLLGLTPASRRYKVRPCRINTHEIAIYSGGGVWGRLSGDAGDPRARWQIPPRPLNRPWICHLDVTGLDASFTPV